MPWRIITPGSGTGIGAVPIATRSTDSNPAVFTSEANRDTYYTTNPGDIANTTALGRGREAVAIGPVDGDASNITGAFIRNDANDAWVPIATNFIGQTGPVGPTGDPGPSTTFGSIAARDSAFSTANGRALLTTGLPIFVLKGNDVSPQYWGGVDNPSTYNANFWVNGGVDTTPGSVTLGNIRIFSLGNALGLENLGTGETFVAQGIEYTDASGSVTTDNIPVLGAEEANTPQNAQDVTVTAQTSDFTITATVDQVLTRYSLWFAADTDDVSIRVYDGDSNTDPVLIDVVQDMVAGENEIIFPSRPRFVPGREYLTEYSTTSTQLNLMGSNVGPGSSFFPRFQSYGMPYSEVTAINSANIAAFMNAVLTEGSNVTLNYDAQAGTITINSTGGGGGTPRTDEEIRDVIVAMLQEGTDISLVEDDNANTLTINYTGGTPTPTPGTHDLRYGLTTQSDPALVDFGTLTDVADPTDPQTLSTGVTTAGQYFHIFNSNGHPIESITDTVLQQIVYQRGGTGNIFNFVADARTESGVTYNALTIGPLNAGVDEDYVLRFS